MKLDTTTVALLAERLENCELQAEDTLNITEKHPEMDWENAYPIHDEIRRRKIARGSKIIRLKGGLTSLPTMKPMGVRKPVFGFLADYLATPDGGTCDVTALIHPKVEPEIAFFTKTVLRGPGCHIGAVFAATDFVMPGIEVIDSRYRDFKFDLKSVVADNTSAARFVIGGQPVSASHFDLRTIGIVLKKTVKRSRLGRAPRYRASGCSDCDAGQSPRRAWCRKFRPAASFSPVVSLRQSPCKRAMPYLFGFRAWAVRECVLSSGDSNANSTAVHRRRA
uniref:4-oxalocrotonate decarboxylase n=1 Tax=Burkholderia cepacia TaxID=292 RepID=O07067_BURCE|nr:4-oxalocrotonate decarboxylase [Burkholderia cepacia]